MPLAYGLAKAKLPRGLSFPLKRSVLDAALLEGGVSRVHTVYFWIRRGGHMVMRADFCGEGRKDRFAAGQSSITVYAVPSVERLATETAVTSEMLPGLVGWLKSLEKAGNTRRGVDQYFAAILVAGSVAIEMS